MVSGHLIGIFKDFNIFIWKEPTTMVTVYNVTMSIMLLLYNVTIVMLFIFHFWCVECRSYPIDIKIHLISKNLDTYF